MIHDSLLDYHMSNAFMLFQRDKGFINNFTFADLENMLPFEKDAYLTHMKRLIEEEVKSQNSA